MVAVVVVGILDGDGASNGIGKDRPVERETLIAAAGESDTGNGFMHMGHDALGILEEYGRPCLVLGALGNGCGFCFKFGGGGLPHPIENFARRPVD